MNPWNCETRTAEEFVRDHAQAAGSVRQLEREMALERGGVQTWLGTPERGWSEETAEIVRAAIGLPVATTGPIARRLRICDVMEAELAGAPVAER